MGTYATALQFLLPRVLGGVPSAELLPKISVQEMETPDALLLLRSGALGMLVGYKYLDGDPPSAKDLLRVTPIANEAMLLVAPIGEVLSFDECGGRLDDWRRSARRSGRRANFRPEQMTDCDDNGGRSGGSPPPPISFPAALNLIKCHELPS
ncbi:MAG: hypothetical protein H7248_06555 [Microbacteriaceae bacterium]|nr:hypothetical protein [Microbacteriaceae bacterium]